MSGDSPPSDLSGLAPAGPGPAPAATAPTPGSSGDSAGIGEALRAIDQRIAALRQDFATKIQYDQAKDGQIDRLHLELAEYKKGLQYSLLRPILFDLIGMYDDLGQFVEHHRGTLADNLIKSLQSFQQGIIETLRRNGVELYEEAGDVYNNERQRVNLPIDTPDPAFDRRVARRVRPGFTYEGRIVREQLVDVYRYSAR